MLDGNHRVSVARQLGLETIEAYVCVFPTPVGLSPEADMNELPIKSEQVWFLEKIGEAAPPAVRDVVFTCPGCYSYLTDMIDWYLQGLEKAHKKPVSFEEAVSAWYEEVYGPCLERIQRSKLLARLPNRTEADLFVWAWKNNDVLEELVLEEENPSSETR